MAAKCLCRVLGAAISLSSLSGLLLLSLSATTCYQMALPAITCHSLLSHAAMRICHQFFACTRFACQLLCTSCLSALPRGECVHGSLVGWEREPGQFGNLNGAAAITTGTAVGRMQKQVPFNGMMKATVMPATEVRLQCFRSNNKNA